MTVKHRLFRPAMLTAMSLIMISACSPEVEKTPFHFVEATIEDVQSSILAGDMSCVDIVRGYQQRIDTYDKS